MALSPIALDDLSAFLHNFPTPLHHRQPDENSSQLWVFWSHDEGSQISSSSGDHSPLSFYAADLHPRTRKLIVQLWAPVTIGGRRLLSTSAQPFAVTSLDNDLKKYRLRSMEYHYNIDVSKQLHIQEEEEENQGYPMILSGGPAAAFLNCMPELVRMKDHRGSPLARYALYCGLKTSIMLPVCLPSQISSCIGVVECALPLFTDLENLADIKSELMKQRATINVQDRIPYKAINGLKPTRDYVGAALKKVCLSHNLQLAQAWISYADEIHVPVSSFLEDTRTKRMTALKLTGYVNKVSTAFCDHVKSYDICDIVCLKNGDLVEKTLQDYKPRFCKSIYILSDDTLIPDLLSRGVAICLRNTVTGDLDYAFEFIWHHTSNDVMLLEELFLTLKRCLPCFKLASGAELGDELELNVINDSPYSGAENSTESETKSFMIYQGRKSSPLPIALEAGKKPMFMDSCKAKWKTAPKELSKQDIEKQFGNTMKEAAKSLKVSLSTLKRKCKVYKIAWQGPNVVKKKVNTSSNNQSNRNEEHTGAIQEPSLANKMENTLTIKAEYADDTIKFDLHTSQASFVTVEKEIGKKLNLTPGTYKLKYLDKDDDLILLTSDQDMSDCIKYFINLGQTVLRLRVLPSPQKP